MQVLRFFQQAITSFACMEKCNSHIASENSWGRYKRIINLYVPDNMHPLSISPLCYCCLLFYVQADIFTFKIWFSSLSLSLYAVHQNIDESEMKLWQFRKYVLSRMFRSKRHPHRCRRRCYVWKIIFVTH